MSLADELKYILSTGGNSTEIQDFVVANQNAILSALRGMETINLDAEGFRALRRAASKSPWIPPEYVVNDWLADCVDFLSNPLPPQRDAVLEEAAKVCEEPVGVCCGAYEYGAEYMGQREIVCCGSPDLQPMDASQCAAAIRAMKEGKHV